MRINDAIDDRIVRELRRNGRQSNADLAERVGLSPSAVSRRVRDLERRGVLAGYRARIGREAAGIGFVAYMAVGLNDHSKPAQEAFERALQTVEAVVECHNVTGTVEYLLRVEVSDLPAYKHFHTEVLGALPQVATITTYVVMGSPKDERG